MVGRSRKGADTRCPQKRRQKRRHNPTCYYLSFVFPATLIWLLHCNAMHFDSFSLGARHLFQKLVLFFM
jgi:hypothetical protein